MRKKIFLVISEEDTICPECGSPLCRRDRKLRVHKEAGGKKSWFAINRLKCTNEKCRRLHNELPDCMIPYKHYGSDIIEDVVDEVVGSDDLGTEDYPCEGTMKHWKWWISQNEANIGGQMRSMLHHLMDFDIKFLKSSDSLLKELKGRISPGSRDRKRNEFVTTSESGIETAHGIFNIITYNDLSDFSDELQNEVKRILEMSR